MACATTSFTASPSFSNANTLFSSNNARHSPSSYVTFRRSLPAISAVYSTSTAEESSSVGVASTVSLQTASFYEVLGIPAGASGKEIKAAYRKLARVIHPDVLVSSNRQRDATSADEFIRVHEAYSTLSDPKKRADYDRMMWVKGRRLTYSPAYCTHNTTKYGHATTSSSAFSGYARRTRTWETDQCW